MERKEVTKEKKNALGRRKLKKKYALRERKLHEERSMLRVEGNYARRETCFGRQEVKKKRSMLWEGGSCAIGDGFFGWKRRRDESKRLRYDSQA